MISTHEQPALDRAGRGTLWGDGDHRPSVVQAETPGVTLNGDGRQASARQGYLFAQESPKSISVIKIVDRGAAHLQTGTLECVPVDKMDPHEAYCSALIQSKTSVSCQGRARCHFVGIL
jgi:hypothetical protein